MKKKDIVKNQRDFSRIINKGQKFNNNSFVIYYDNNNINHSRYGISVSKKIGNSVLRNKYKRKIRFLIDNNKCLYYKNKDYIILLRKQALNFNFDKLKQDFNQLLDKLEEI